MRDPQQLCAKAFDALGHVPATKRASDPATARRAFAQLVADARFADGLRCVHCSGSRVIGWGRYRERCRYRCRDCGRTFNALTGTPFDYSKMLEAWPEYLVLMRTQTTLRRAALRLEMHLSTSFRWRHRFLGSAFRSTERLAGLIELKEALFPYSEKGSRRLCGRPAHERGGYADKMEWITRRRVRVVLLVARSGSAAAAIFIGRVPVFPDVVAALRTLVAPGGTIIVVEPRNSLYRSAVREARLGLHTVPPGPLDARAALLVHVGNGRRFERRLRTWLLPFRGVATKYLSNYLAWHRFSDRDELQVWLSSFVGRAVAGARPGQSG